MVRERETIWLDRAAYARPTVEAPAAPPPEVRLVAVFSVGGAARATLRIDGVETVVAEGDATPAGVVAAIEHDAVVFGGAEGRRVGLFE